MYKPLNVAITLSLLRIWSTRDLITVQSDSKVTLDSFGNWRKTVLLREQNHDCAHLLTDITFTKNVIGVAYKKGMCDPKLSVGLVQDYSSNVFVVAAIMTHELGHNLGMEHDEDENGKKCKCDTCIMSPAISDPPAQKYQICSNRQCVDVTTAY
ncbi:zinc metalloproteinase/disintegrin-like [Protobothrops mucrosquamatus]|uniref:zinc metalloproteinase/disintegrin-like n=1 Tax=Protobothrops mucrosquamatus TaxID=103944 RepID=UPI000775BF8F|nr:zinc metalloproteinase/disintegrin-like [Protobothrops mucrosquamatus]